MTPLYWNLFAGLLGGAAGALGMQWMHCRKIGSYKALSATIVQEAELEAERIKKSAENDAKQNEAERQKAFQTTWDKERRQLQKEEDRLKQREDKFEERYNMLQSKLSQIEKKELSLADQKGIIESEKLTLAAEQKKLISEFEHTSGITSLQAKELLLAKIQEEVRFDTANYIARSIKEAEETADRQVSRILASAINRLAVPCVSESTVCTVTLTGEEIKARIIGREGRNIRTLERLTGVNFLIDDTPNTVVISGFDPIRLHVAKTALSELVKDGRIHPSSIEEAVLKAQGTVHKKMIEFGEDAALRMGQVNLHSELIKLLGALKFRNSLGQNVLDHSIEVGHLMGMIAEELHLDVSLAKRIGLLHDVGKSATHEYEGTHAIIGHDLALKYGESKEVANGIGCHHNEMEPLTVEASFCGAADAISASRPGARIEHLEEYLRRLQQLEDIAYSFPGIEKAYAMQAGREIVITVLPDMIDDNGALNLARDLSKKIEKELRYSGKIKVTVIREKRAVGYAVQ